MGELVIYNGVDCETFEKLNKKRFDKVWDSLFVPPSFDFIKRYGSLLGKADNITEYNVIKIIENSMDYVVKSEFARVYVREVKEAYSNNTIATSIVKNAAINMLSWSLSLINVTTNPAEGSSILVKSEKHSKYGCWLMKILAECGYSLVYVTTTDKLDLIPSSKEYKVIRCSNPQNWGKYYMMLGRTSLAEQLRATNVRPTVKVEQPRPTMEQPKMKEQPKVLMHVPPKVSVADYTRPYIVPKYNKSVFSNLDELIMNIKNDELCSCVICGCGDNYQDTHNKLFQLREVLLSKENNFEKESDSIMKNRINYEIMARINKNSFQLKEPIFKLKMLTTSSEEAKNLVAKTAADIAVNLSDKNMANLFRSAIEWYFKNKVDNLKDLYTVSIGVASLLEEFTLNRPAKKLVAYFGDISDVPVESIIFLDIISRYKITTVLVNWNIETVKGLEGNYSLLGGDWHEIKLGVPCNNTEYPRSELRMKVSTMAREATREVDELLYDGKTLGMYKTNQFNMTNSVVLSTTLEEISLLWKVEATARPSFKVDASSNIVTVPTIFADIAGAGDMESAEYFTKIRELVTDHTQVYINEHTKLDRNSTNFGEISNIRSMLERGSDLVLPSGKLNIDRVRKVWTYSRLNSNKQELILNKLQEAIDNIGYTKIGGDMCTKAIVAMLTLPQNIVNDIIWFDFTKVSPKIIMIFDGNTGDNLEDKTINEVDCLRLYFCNLIGFDVAVFTPTSYKSMESVLDRSLYEYYDLGNPKFDMRVPQVVKTMVEGKSEGLFKRIFGL